MSFEAGNPTTEVKVFTGLASFIPIMVNPTKDELVKLKVTLKEEPVYTSKTEEGNTRTRIDIWGQIEETKTFQKITFFVEDAFKESKSTPGNYQFINEFGTSAWGQSVEEIKSKYSWYKGENIRKAYSGEADLISFIQSWLSIGKDLLCKFENPAKIAEGNVTELRNLVTKFKDRKVQVLLTVREYEGSFYQSIYNRYFSRAFNKTTTYWEKHLSNSQSPIEYQNSFALKEFNPLAVDSSSETPDEDNLWDS